MKIAAFDIEIAKEIPEGVSDWETIAPLGISCAALYLDDVNPPVESHYGIPQMSETMAVDLVVRLQQLRSQGYTIVTWNGCGFDFHVLAQESKLIDECVDMALNHVDLMLLVTFQRGFMLGLNKACMGAGLAGKTHEVALKAGGTLTEMNGALAPRLWSEGETDAVLTYLAGDVEQTNKLAHNIDLTKSIRWISNSGRPNACGVLRLRTVQECFEWPIPDTSWMTRPITREQFIDWMPVEVQEKLLNGR